MGSRARLASILLATLGMTACAAPGTSPTPAPPTWSLLAATPGVTPEPCAIAVTHLGSFTQRLAVDLAALRPLVVATPFDASETATADRVISATLTAYEGLEADLQKCQPTVDLAVRVAALRKSAQATLNLLLPTPYSVPKTHRDGAVALFGLLPEVLAMSKAAQAAADTLGLQIALATVPAGANKPLGSLAPLPTPVPVAAVTPRPTPRPTARPQAVPRSTAPPTNGAAWRTAQQYLTNVGSTYSDLVVGPTPVSWSICSDPAQTGSVRAACMQTLEGEQASITRFNAHRTWMNKHPVACLRDAYASDRTLMNFLQKLMGVGFIAAGYDFIDVQHRLDAFYAKLPSYVSDCH